MEFNRFLLLFSLLILGLLSADASATNQRSRLVGGYQPIKDPSDPYVVEIAMFAVSEHNKDASDDLVFVKVLSGQQQVVAGMNYKLVIVAKHGAARANSAGDQYQVVVYDKPWEKYRSLTSFQKV